MQQPQGGMVGGKSAPEPESIRNLMVNYIPTTIDEVQLRQLFEMYGPVESVKIVVDRDTRTSKGYGFVKFRFSVSAVHAIQYLNGYPLLNKRLKVAYSKQEEAQKAMASPQEGGNMAAMYPMASPEMDPQYLWAQQMYMQQLAALQMMQLQQAMPHHHHHAQHQQQHHHAARGHQQYQHQHQQQQQQSPAGQGATVPAVEGEAKQ